MFNIVKVGGDGVVNPSVGTSRKRTMKTYPRGVLKTGKSKAKLQAVRDPAKPPPVRKSTLKILTEKGVEARRRHIKKTVRNMPEGKVRHLLKASGLPVSEKTPAHIAKGILEDGMEAGMIVAK